MLSISAPNPTVSPPMNSTTGTNGTNTTQNPIGTSINPAGCPSIDGNLYSDNTTVTSPQTFQIQCYRAFSTPNYQATNETSLPDCIAACDNINGGGSIITGGQSGLFCFGVTWLRVCLQSVCHSSLFLLPHWVLNCISISSPNYRRNLSFLTSLRSIFALFRITSSLTYAIVRPRPAMPLENPSSAGKPHHE